MEVIGVGVDIHAVRLALAKFSPELEKEFKATFKKYATEGKSMMKSGAHVRSGYLAASIGYRVKFNKTMTGFQIDSSGAHGVSRYRWPQDSGRHSGPSSASGSRYITNTQNVVMPRAVDAITKDFDRIVSKFNNE